MNDEYNKIEVRKQEDLAASIGNADLLLNKSYLSGLNNADRKSVV